MIRAFQTRNIVKKKIIKVKLIYYLLYPKYKILMINCEWKKNVTNSEYFVQFILQTCLM